MGEKVQLKGVHLLLTYKCVYECDHCFVWSSPRSAGTMSLAQVQRILLQAAQIPSVDTIYFEGGEPFLFYPLLLEGVRMAREMGFGVGIVSNAYWASNRDDAAMWLRPLSQLGIKDLSLSEDEYHGEEESSRKVHRARSAARSLGIPVQVLRVKGIKAYTCDASGNEQGGDLYFRGRGAANLADKAEKRPWRELSTCPEGPPDIGRVHIDAYGTVEFCQGISIGNVWHRPLKQVMEDLAPTKHPIIGPLIRGGPAQLAIEAKVKPKNLYADPCHLCYEVRCRLRKSHRLVPILRPDQAYGED